MNRFKLTIAGEASEEHHESLRELSFSVMRGLRRYGARVDMLDLNGQELHHDERGNPDSDDPTDSPALEDRMATGGAMSAQIDRITHERNALEIEVENLRAANKALGDQVDALRTELDGDACA